MTTNRWASVDLLTDLLCAAEKRFADFDLGVDAEVPMPDGQALVFNKHGGKWVLSIRTAGDTLHPLIESGMKMRVQAGFLLEELHRALLKKIDERELEVQKSIEAVQAFLAKP
jgi:hypothetical protein